MIAVDAAQMRSSTRRRERRRSRNAPIVVDGLDPLMVKCAIVIPRADWTRSTISGLAIRFPNDARMEYDMDEDVVVVTWMENR